MLRGALAGSAVAIGLPVLEAMQPRMRTAHAEGTIPDRFGLWFWGNGIRRELWVPPTTGPGYTPSEELMPLLGVRDYVSVVTNTNVTTGDTFPHHSGIAGILTGDSYLDLGPVRDTRVGTLRHPSVDQLAADALQGTAPYRSLEVAVCRFRGADEGTTFIAASHGGPSLPNRAEESPAALFERLFGVTPANPAVRLARRSVLDVVSSQARRLQSKLGANDRLRVDQHLESIRLIEQRLATPSMACTTPPNPGEFPDRDGAFELVDEKNEAVSQLIALALACDLTRVFTLQYSTAGSGAVFWQVGIANGQHQLTHDEAPPQPLQHQAVIFTMGRFARFLEILRGTPEADGNLLDHVSILGTSELSEGWNHTNHDYPILIAGRGHGRLTGGVHHRFATETNTSRAVLSALRGAGLTLDGFGHGGGLATEGITELGSV